MSLFSLESDTIYVLTSMLVHIDLIAIAPFCNPSGT